ncbi:Hypothetical protein CINCED_3A001312 [Cinara cedri]|uniref:Uncharacterized protein n=1 Tax=Cinara cedri TaxID=506608 RepID=A0A5E4N1Q2_9HEMI|nr:Hypothetical protein CINCED_3A001312 [Cinara cedri]
MFVSKRQCKNEYYWNNQSALNWFFEYTRTPCLIPLIECGTLCVGYTADASPVYASFETTNDSAVIYGWAVKEDRRPIGYRVEDVTVRLPNQKEVADVPDAEISCLVITVSPHRVVGKSDSLSGSLDAVRTVEVTVGSFPCRVHRKPVQHSSGPSTVCHVVIAISTLSLFAGIIFLCVFWLKTTKRYTIKTDPVVDYHRPSQCVTNLTEPKSDVVDIRDVIKNNDL